MRLVPHHCPKHGYFGVDAPDTALVEHGVHGCFELCAPEGVDPKVHKRAYTERGRVRRAMRIRRLPTNSTLRNIGSPDPLLQAKSETPKAPTDDGVA